MPKIVDHDQYRKELLSKCFDLFAEKGYRSITMRQIAEGLRVSTQTLYHLGEKINDAGIADLAQTDKMVAVTEVYQTDISKVKLGQQAIITS